MGQCEHGTFAQNIDILGNNTTKKLKKYTQNYENRCFLIRDWVAEIYFWAVGWPPLLKYIKVCAEKIISIFGIS
jgi:hypothetical protein